MKKNPDIKLKLSATLLECCIMHEMLQKMRMQHGMFTIEKKINEKSVQQNALSEFHDFTLTSTSTINVMRIWRVW